MPYLLIDAHEDLAYNALTFGRNYLNSSSVTRSLEINSDHPLHGGECTLGWRDWQHAKAAVVFSTLFIMPKRHLSVNWETVGFASPQEAERLYHQQIDYYHKLEDDHPDKFRIIEQAATLNEIWRAWQADLLAEHPVGLVLLMEGAEGLREPQEIERWYQAGVRIVGPVWAGTRFCGGMYEGEGFTREGWHLLEIMSQLGIGLDIAHMNEKSALQALELYEGVVLASHANARALLKWDRSERHLTDLTIQRLAARGGVVGVMPFNRFLAPDWTNSQPRDKVKLDHLADHIDHICQVSGSARHVAIGTDFDGGFGYPAIPLELNSIAEIQLLAGVLQNRGYQEEEIEGIFGLNWKSILERILPK